MHNRVEGSAETDPSNAVRHKKFLDISVEHLAEYVKRVEGLYLTRLPIISRFNQ